MIKWSAWWALATCGYLQIINYMQLLWQTAVGPDDMIYNGAVDFIYAIVGEEKLVEGRELSSSLKKLK